MPFTTWNGVEPLPGTERSGYCTHSSVLFPTWHRPYLALFEVHSRPVRCRKSQGKGLTLGHSNKCLKWSTRLRSCFPTPPSASYTSKRQLTSGFPTGTGHLRPRKASRIFRKCSGAQLCSRTDPMECRTLRIHCFRINFIHWTKMR